MKKWTGFLVFALLLSLPVGCSSGNLGGGDSVNPPEDWTVLGGGYSVNLPEGWTAGEFPGSPYKGLFGTRVNDFTPNINIQEQSYSGSMDSYIELNMKQIEKLMKAKKINQSTFYAKNHEGVKVVTNTQLNDLMLTQILYFFENPQGKKVSLIATSSRESGSQYGPVFDGIVGTFHMK